MSNPSSLFILIQPLDTLYRISVIKMFIGIDFTFTNKVFIKLMQLKYGTKKLAPSRQKGFLLHPDSTLIFLFRKSLSSAGSLVPLINADEVLHP